MYILTIIVLIMLLLVAIIKNKKKNMVIIGFYIIWLIITTLCSLKLYGLLDFSERIYYVIIIGVVGFSIGYYLLKNIKLITLRKKFSKNKIYDYKINIKALNSFLYIIIIFYLVQLVKVVQLILNGVSWINIRYYYYTTGYLFNEFEKIISSWVVLPFIFYLLAPILLNLYFEGLKNKKIFILTIICLVLHIIVTQGKEVFIYWFMSILISLSLNYKKISIKNKKMVFNIIILMIIFIFIIQFNRTGQISIKFLYNYLGISFTVMDNWLNYIDSNNIIAYGLSFFNGILNIPFSLIEKVAGFYPENLIKVNQELNYMMSTGIRAFESNRETTNVYITMFTFFYYDLRYVGVFLGSFVSGSLIGRITKKFYNSPKTSYYKVLYCIIALSAWCSFIYWKLFITPYLLSIIYLRMLYRKRIIGEEI